VRILGFEKAWPKLDDEIFTTFRFPRRDLDWLSLELVQVVVNPRSKNRQPLGTAKILAVEPRRFQQNWRATPRAITWEEARLDGFESYEDMLEYMVKRYGEAVVSNRLINRITLKWEERFE